MILQFPEHGRMMLQPLRSFGIVEKQFRLVFALIEETIQKLLFGVFVFQNLSEQFLDFTSKFLPASFDDRVGND